MSPGVTLGDLFEKYAVSSFVRCSVCGQEVLKSALQGHMRVFHPASRAVEAPRHPAPPAAAQRQGQLAEELNSLTKRQLLEHFTSYGTFDKRHGKAPLWDRYMTKQQMVSYLPKWAVKHDMVEEVLEVVRLVSGERQFEQQERAQDYQSNLDILNKYFPEWKTVLSSSGGRKPRKFVESLRVIPTPATWNPTAIGDFDVAHTFHYDSRAGKLGTGPMYSYDTLLTVSGGRMHERQVELRPGDRFWNVVYSGQWGGYWAAVNVYVNPEQQRRIESRYRLPSGR